jgi:hypothetical protein
MTLASDARVVPRPDVAVREIDDGAVLVNMGSGACFELNRVGFEIWRALGPGATIAGICDALGGRYSVEREALAADVGSLVGALVAASLVDVL